jgi:hypothetical protein
MFRDPRTDDTRALLQAVLRNSSAAAEFTQGAASEFGQSAAAEFGQSVAAEFADSALPIVRR